VSVKFLTANLTQPTILFDRYTACTDSAAAAGYRPINIVLFNDKFQVDQEDDAVQNILCTKVV
jgi:hypothetical protein